MAKQSEEVRDEAHPPLSPPPNKHRGILIVALVGAIVAAGLLFVQRQSLIGGVAVVVTGEEPVKTVVVLREPEMRQINVVKDGAILERINLHHDKLPEPYRSRHNFAWAAANLDGLDKTEYFAHSGIQSLDIFSQPIAQQLEGISLKPADGAGRFMAESVNRENIMYGPDSWSRRADTEYKIIEEIAERQPNTSVAGSMTLYTELPPCASCWFVIKQFLGTYSNVQMQVLYQNR